MSGKNKEVKSIADASIADASIADAREDVKLIAADAREEVKLITADAREEVEKPDRAYRLYLLNSSVVDAHLSSKVNFDLGVIAAMTYGYTKDDLDCLVKGAANLAETQKKSVIEKMDFIEEVVKQSLDAAKKNAKLPSFDKGVVSGHESGLAVVRTDIANLRQPRVQGSLKNLLQLEHTLQKRLKYQNLKFRNYALRRLEMIWNSGGIYCCWFPYMAMKLFDCLPPLIDGDVDLVVLCCLTLACKMQKKRFHTTGFLLERGLMYNLDEVVAMELNLLRSLQWNTRQLTPFCFLQCLGHDLTTSCNMRLVYSVIVWTQANMAFAYFSPSTIAYSAILCGTRCEDSKTIREKLHEVECIDECTNLMAALYNMKLFDGRADSTNTIEESWMNIALEWIEQLPSSDSSEAKVGICERALGCLFPLLQCFKTDPEIGTSGPSTETSTSGPSTETSPSTETTSGPSTETSTSGPSTKTSTSGPSTETNSASPSTETNPAEINISGPSTKSNASRPS